MAQVSYSERYPVCVDVSAKIEAWDKPSVIAVANGHKKALLVQPEVKIAAARLVDPSEPVRFTLLAVFTFVAISPDLDSISRITIDRDYSGELAERQILRRLVRMIRRTQPIFRASVVRIAEVQGSTADRLAREVYRGLRKPDGVINLSDVQAVL